MYVFIQRYQFCLYKFRIQNRSCMSDIHLLLREFLSNPIASNCSKFYYILRHDLPPSTWRSFRFSNFEYVSLLNGNICTVNNGRNAPAKFSASITLATTMFRFLVHIIFHQNPTDDQSVLLLVKADRLKPSD